MKIVINSGVADDLGHALDVAQYENIEIVLEAEQKEDGSIEVYDLEMRWKDGDGE